MLHDNFIKTTKQESPEFVALLNILSSLNSHTEEGRKLLCVLNNIIDYYIHREIDPSDDVKMPIVYFPVCEDWAQMLCEEFVALKMSLLWGKSTRTNILSSYIGCILITGCFCALGCAVSAFNKNTVIAYIITIFVLWGVYSLNLDFLLTSTQQFSDEVFAKVIRSLNFSKHYQDVVSGQILIDGTNIKDLDLDSLRQNIAVVFQDNFLFDGTIRENILLGNENAKEEEIQKAIRMACLDEFIKTLKDGLDTRIGERGVLLSGGQKQRIAIARAFLKNAPIVILDEATSALDNKSEAVVQQAIDNLMQDRTVLIIAHRLSTVRNANKIFGVHVIGVAICCQCVCASFGSKRWRSVS